MSRIPQDIQDALKKKPAVWAKFEALAPSHQREYVEWIASAKRDDTRQRRIQQTVERLQAGRS